VQKVKLVSKDIKLAKNAVLQLEKKLNNIYRAANNASEAMTDHISRKIEAKVHLVLPAMVQLLI